MASFLGRFGRAVKASVQAFGTARFSIRGEVIRCPVCHGDEFARAPGGPLSKPLLLGFTAPWLKLDRQATALICAHCTHMMHFGSAPEVMTDDSFPVNPSTTEGST